MALTTTTTSSPARRVRATWSATARIRSASPTEVPPNFWTTRDMGVDAIRPGRPTRPWPGPRRRGRADTRAVTGVPANTGSGAGRIGSPPVPTDKRARQRPVATPSWPPRPRSRSAADLLRNTVIIVVIVAVVGGSVYLICRHSKNSSATKSTTTTTAAGSTTSTSAPATTTTGASTTTTAADHQRQGPGGGQRRRRRRRMPGQHVGAGQQPGEPLVVGAAHDHRPHQDLHGDGQDRRRGTFTDRPGRQGGPPER